MGCVFITGVGVAGAIPETDVDYYFFLKNHMQFLYGKFQTYAKVGRMINTSSTHLAGRLQNYQIMADIVSSMLNPFFPS